MFDLPRLLWAFLESQPSGHYLQLISWHLLLLLWVLAVLAAFGLHFLVGHLFGFYRRKGRIARWVSWPGGVMWLVSLQVLLGSYLLTGQASTLVRLNLTDRVTERLGSLLLEPAFRSPVLLAQGEGEIAKSVLKTALTSSSELEYRSRLESFLLDPSEIGGGPPGESSPPAESTAPARGGDPEELLVQIGLRWVTSPHRTWLSPLRPGGVEETQPEAQETPFFLPEFLETLIGEMPPDATLTRDNWEHVAGTRFVDGVLKPLMEEYLSYLAAFLAGLVVLVNVLFFLAMRRIRRIGTPKPEKGAKGAKAAATAQIAAPAPAAQQTAPPATQPVPAASLPAGPGEGAAPPPAESPEQGAGKSGDQPARSEQDVEQDASGTRRPRSRRSWWRRRA